MKSPATRMQNEMAQKMTTLAHHTMDRAHSKEMIKEKQLDWIGSVWNGMGDDAAPAFEMSTNEQIAWSAKRGCKVNTRLQTHGPSKQD